jgi:chaperonin GroES
MPMEDQIAVQILEVKDTTEGGIVVPEMANKNLPYHRGKVVSVGPGRWQDGVLIKPDVEIGDVVFFGKRVGAELKVGVEIFTILRVGSLFAKEGK